MASKRILTTRPADYQAALQARLREAGFEPVPLPLIEIEPIDLDTPEQGATRSHILNLDLYSTVIFISRNAARIGGELIDQYWPQLPIGVNWLAIGKGTAQALSDWGIEARANTGLDSEALLEQAELQNLTGERILIIKGVGGRDHLARELEQRGAKVDLAEVYRRNPPKLGETEQTRAFAHPLDAILITSGEALNTLTALAEGNPHLKRCPLIVPGQRLEQCARSQGYTQILISTGADDESMISCLKTLF